MAADQGGDGAQKKSKTIVHTVKDGAKSLTFIVFDLYKAVLRGALQLLFGAWPFDSAVTHSFLFVMQAPAKPWYRHTLGQAARESLHIWACHSPQA